LANASPDGAGADVTADFTIVVTTGGGGAKFVVTNTTAAPAYLTFLQLRGKRVLDHGTAQHIATDATSITTHGEHAVEFDMPYQALDTIGQATADFILDKWMDPLSQAREIVVLGKTTALLTQILTRDISDKITLSETVTGVSDDFHINGMTLTITPDGYVQARYTLAVAMTPASGNYFVLGTSELGGPDILAPF
jgi:hypothetical protein